jgi:uncharacterized protein (TIRG00374 family)
MNHEDPQGDTPPKSHRTRRVLLGFVTVLLVVVGVAWFASDGRALLAAASKISWTSVLLPVGATLISYALMAASYEGIATAAHRSIGFGAMHRITYVSNTINYIVSTGGLSGFAARMYLFRKHGIPLGRAVTISFVQGLLTNLTLLLFLIVGFAFLVTHESLGRTAIASAAAALTLFTIATFVLVSLFVHPPSRRKCLLWIVGAGHALSRRLVGEERAPRRIGLLRLAHNIDDGFGFMLQNRQAMLAPVAFIVADWFMTLGVLWGCFYAVGLEVPLPLVTVGFAIGILTTLISITPAGLGIMESAMTTIFVSLGTPLEPTIIAVLLFRLTFYALPFTLSVGFFHGMFEDARRHTHI